MRTQALLGPLCDLQAVTGIAIIIAGWSQYGTINYYHSQLVLYYWYLTLNSFWASRVDYLNVTAQDDGFRMVVRRVAIFASCVLAVAFQIYVFILDNCSWSDDPKDWGEGVTDGPCFRYQDGTSSIPWIIGIGLFSIALALSCFRQTQFLNTWYLEGTDSVRKWLLKRSSRHWASVVTTVDIGSLPKVLKFVLDILVLLFGWLCVALYWLFLQWLSVWSYGDGFYPFTWVVYIAFNVWNTWDVMDIWTRNKSLIKDDEVKWGFGQVLPLVMVLSVMFTAVDIFRGEYLQHLETRHVSDLK